LKQLTAVAAVTITSKSNNNNTNNNRIIESDHRYRKDSTTVVK